MDITEVTKVSGLPASTLRYYEEMGLIESSGRNGLRRLFNPSVIQRLTLISLGRNAGFSLDEISKMFTPDGVKINRSLLLVKANELDKKIKELTSMREGLRHAAACSAPNHFECPKFMRILKITQSKRLRPVGELKKNKKKKNKK